MQDGQIELAMEAYSRHVELLLSKLKEYKDEKKKIETINEDLKLVISFLSELRVKFMEKQGTKFEPIFMNEEAFQEALERFPKIARDTITRMITYKFPKLTFSDIVGHQEAKKVLLEAFVKPTKHGSLWNDKSRTTGILLFGICTTSNNS